MSKQVYFVIGVDIDSKEPFIDDESFMARFGKHEQVWDTDLECWIDDDNQNLYSQALEILNTTSLAKE